MNYSVKMVAKTFLSNQLVFLNKAYFQENDDVALQE